MPVPPKPAPMSADPTPSILEHRLRAIEDRLAIYNLIASHPPSADTGARAHAEAVYVEDGSASAKGQERTHALHKKYPDGFTRRLWVSSVTGWVFAG